MLLTVEMLFILLLMVVLVMIYGLERASFKKSKSQAIVKEYWTGKERRKYMRFKTALEVAYTVEKKHHLKSSAKMVDISEGGMKLMLDEKLSPGTILDLKVFLPKPKKTAELEGHVVWSEDVPEKDPSEKRLFYSGVKFSALKEPYQNSLVEYINSISGEQEA